MGVKRSNSLDKVTFLSDEKRFNLSLTSYKAIPVTLTNVETGEILRFTSKNKAAEYLNVSQPTIKNYIINNKICKGYTICLDPIKKKSECWNW